jgi:hypothetical protein
VGEQPRRNISVDGLGKTGATCVFRKSRRWRFEYSFLSLVAPTIMAFTNNDGQDCASSAPYDSTR